MESKNTEGAEMLAPQAADVACQRIKALEKSVTDGQWKRAKFLELVLVEQEDLPLTDRGEENMMRKEQEWDDKIRGKGAWNQWNDWTPRGGKDQEDRKGKGKKGKGRGRSRPKPAPDKPTNRNTPNQRGEERKTLGKTAGVRSKMG